MRDRQRAEDDEVGVDFAVAAQLGGQVVAAASRADVTAQKVVGRFVACVAGKWTAAVAQGDATDEAAVVEIGFDFVHVRTGSRTAYAVNTSPGEGFGFDRDQLAAAADVVMELAVGNQHARKLTARVGADKFRIHQVCEPLASWDI